MNERGFRRLVAACFAIAAVIHLLPVTGVLGRARLTALYGITISDPQLLLLMRHRAVSLGVLGVLLLCAAFRPPLQSIAFLCGLLSAGAFLWLAVSEGVGSSQLVHVAAADAVAIACLCTGLAARLWSTRTSSAPGGKA